jgi:hypothetical protein
MLVAIALSIGSMGDILRPALVLTSALHVLPQTSADKTSHCRGGFMNIAHQSAWLSALPSTTISVNMRMHGDVAAGVYLDAAIQKWPMPRQFAANTVSKRFDRARLHRCALPTPEPSASV